MSKSAVKLMAWIVKLFHIIVGNYIPLFRLHLSDRDYVGLSTSKDCFFCDVEGAESKFKQYFNHHNAVAVGTSSGRTALLLALNVLKKDRPLKKEVVIPVYSCKSLLDAVTGAGLTPVFVDIEFGLNVSFNTLKHSINQNTLAVIIAHLGGAHVPEVEAIKSFAWKKKAFVIEDVCQSYGGKMNGRWLGETSDIAIYSFGVGKPLTAVNGGMLIARVLKNEFLTEKKLLGQVDKDLFAQRLKYVTRQYAAPPIKSIFQFQKIPMAAYMDAYKYNRLSAIEARLINWQMKDFDYTANRMHDTGMSLFYKLKDVKDIRGLCLEKGLFWTKFSIILSNRLDKFKFCLNLLLRGVAYEEMYTPLHLRPEGRPWRTGLSFPNAESIYDRVINLPLYKEMSEKKINSLAQRVERSVKFSKKW